MKRNKRPIMAAVLAAVLTMTSAFPVLAENTVPDSSETEIISEDTVFPEIQEEHNEETENPVHMVGGVIIPDEEIKAAETERNTDPDELGYKPGIVIAAFDRNTSRETIEAFLNDNDAEISRTLSERGRMYVISISDLITVNTAMEMFGKSDIVKCVSADKKVEPNNDSEVSLLSSQTEITNSEAYRSQHIYEAWDTIDSSGITNEKVKVAVIDTGANFHHEDLEGVINTELSAELYYDYDTDEYYFEPLRGEGYKNYEETPDKSSFHGSGVSSIIAAKSGNGVGFQGVASGGNTSVANNMVDLVVFDYAIGELDEAWSSDVIECELRAKDVGCRVINISLGSNYDPMVEYTVDYLTEEGVLVCAAAGNDNTSSDDNVIVPGGCDNSIGVMNCYPDGKKYPSSNYGNKYDVSATGVLIDMVYGPTTDQYRLGQGTSFATPVVTSIAAMMLYVNPNLEPLEIKDIICRTATDIGDPGYDVMTGWGIVNADAAVKEAIRLKGDVVDPEEPGVPEIKEVESLELNYAGVSDGAEETFEYTGHEIEPEVCISDEGTLLDNSLFDITYENNINVGTATTVVTAAEGSGYEGSATLDFEITPADINKAVVSEISEQLYTGNPITPEIELTMYGETVLIKIKDYTVEYKDNITEGTAIIMVEGTGNYTGMKKITFSIVSDVKDISKAAVTDITSRIYSGSEIRPALNIICDNKTLTENVDYTLRYEDNVNVGTASVIIDGIGQYVGSKTVTFNITPKSIANLTASNTSTQEYTGTQIVPPLTLRDSVKTLEEGTDYVVTYKNNKDAGDAYINITGVGNYTGTKGIKFTIAPKSIANATVKIAAQKYTGQVIVPKATVRVDGKTLTAGRDYTVTCSAKRTGSATATITGIGQYKETVRGTFTITE